MMRRENLNIGETGEGEGLEKNTMRKDARLLEGYIDLLVVLC